MLLFSKNSLNSYEKSIEYISFCLKKGYRKIAFLNTLILSKEIFIVEITVLVFNIIKQTSSELLVKKNLKDTNSLEYYPRTLLVTICFNA